MKCSFTAFPASTFVQRKNNKKSHRASWTLWGFFFLLKRRRNSSWFIVCFTAVSLKRNSATVSCRYTRRPYFFSWLRKSCFCLAFMDCYCKKPDRGAGEIFQRSLLKFGMLKFFSCLGFLFHNVSRFWSSANFHFLFWAIKASKFPSLVSPCHYFTHGHCYGIQILMFP